MTLIFNLPVACNYLPLRLDEFLVAHENEGATECESDFRFQNGPVFPEEGHQLLGELLHLLSIATAHLGGGGGGRLEAGRTSTTIM